MTNHYRWITIHEMDLQFCFTVVKREVVWTGEGIQPRIETVFHFPSRGEVKSAWPLPDWMDCHKCPLRRQTWPVHPFSPQSQLLLLLLPLLGQSTERKRPFVCSRKHPSQNSNSRSDAFCLEGKRATKKKQAPLCGVNSLSSNFKVWPFSMAAEIAASVPLPRSPIIIIIFLESCPFLSVRPFCVHLKRHRTRFLIFITLVMTMAMSAWPTRWPSESRWGSINHNFRLVIQRRTTFHLG